MSTRQQNRFTPWFRASDQLPVREGTYQVRFCIGWRAVPCEWRAGFWWLPGPAFGGKMAVHLRRWPFFEWRGLLQAGGGSTVPPPSNVGGSTVPPPHSDTRVKA